MEYKCDYKSSDMKYKCDYKSSSVSNINRHKKIHLKKFKCSFCKAKFQNEQERNEHETNKHPLQKCRECNYQTNTTSFLKQHEAKHEKADHPRKRRIENEETLNSKKRMKEEIPSIPITYPNNKFKNIIFQNSWKPNPNLDLLKVYQQYTPIIKSDLQKTFLDFEQIKFHVVFTIQFYKYKEEEMIELKHHFNGGRQIILHVKDLDEKIDLSFKEIDKSVEEFIKQESGWVYMNTENIVLRVFKFKPPRGGKYFPIPAWIKNKEAVINIENDDDLCFIYCVIAALMYIDKRVDRHLQDPRKYKNHFHEVDYEHISMPISLDDVRKFEKRNQLAINIYGLNEDKNTVVPYQISKIENLIPINLLLLENDDGECHYLWIKSLDRLLHPNNKVKCSRRYYCPFCQYPFVKKEECEDHQEYCREKDPVKINFPKKKILKFENIKHMIKVPFIITCDFECLIVEKGSSVGNKSEIKSNHKPCGFSIVTTSDYFPRNEILYRGENALTKFLDELEKERNRILKLIKEESHKEMSLTAKEEEEFQNARECWICGESDFSEPLPANIKKAKRKNPHCTNHLKILGPFLGECEMEKTRIPSIKEVSNRRKEIVLELHPDKNSHLDEKTRKDKEEKCKKILSSFQILKDYIIKQKLDDAATSDQSEEWEHCIDEKDISKYKRKILKDHMKVRDHDHFNGKFRGAAHSKCNIKLRVKRKNAKIPVFFHNGTNYDFHIVLEGLSKTEKVPQIGVIAKSLESFIQMSIGKHLVLKDSYRFLSYSLEKLVEDRKDVPNTSLAKLFPATYDFFKQNYPHLPEDEFELLTRKGIYPYSYMDSHAKFDEDKLPPIEAYRNDLTGEELSEEDYEFAKDIWSTFQLQNLGQLHDLYLSTDTHLLADVFNGFRDLAYDVYKLDPAHYLTAPSLSWEAALKVTKVKLQLLDDIDMSLFADNMMNGGYAAVVEHFAKANNTYLKDYDSEKPTSYIFSTDCTNNYGAAMRMSLPTDGFQWVEDASMFTEEYIKNLEADGAIGYFIEADLEYPDYLHDAHDSFPLGPEKIKITSNMLSDYQKNLAEKLGTKPGGTKLCLTLNDKEKYTCHYIQLKQMLVMGLKLKKVHRVLQYNQSKWLKPYIDMNTENRRLAQKRGNKCLEALFKLLINAYFGKTCEDVRKYIDVRLEKDPDKALKKISKFSFVNCKQYDDLLAIEMRKTECTLNKPRYIGNSRLEIVVF